MATKILILAALVVAALANPLTKTLRSDTPQTKPIDLQQPSIVGGYEVLSVDDEDVKTMANFAVLSLSESENSKMSLLKITSAARQVVAGMNYKLHIEITQPDGDVRSCDVIVFDQPWTNTRTITASSCIV